jgi:flagellar basal-body rod modification protein FlgD
VTTSSINAATPAPVTSSTPTAPTDKLANQDVFLQLLVAQLKYQDPQNPADSTQFVTQLAQFTSLREQVQSRTDLDAILKAVQASATAQAAAAASASSSSASQNKSTTTI